jgi:hypothetical protein
MNDDRTGVALLEVATTVDGLLAGASMDQSVEQLPARHRIGVRAYHAYTQASHMANGWFWLVPLGIGAPVLRLIAAAQARYARHRVKRPGPVYVAAVLSVAHLVSTLKAGRINWALGPWQPPGRRIEDEGELTAVFARFERWQALRAALQFATFAAGIWALAANATNDIPAANIPAVRNV